ncbi:hypothetical protein OKW29_001720 [Paraburkholderia sp. CI3]
MLRRSAIAEAGGQRAIIGSMDEDGRTFRSWQEKIRRWA